MSHYDIIIVGGGIAGASLAYELSSQKNILLLEQEFSTGYHATGRSAAFWSQTYGGPDIEPLTSASREFLNNPPTPFQHKSFLRNRGVINIAHRNQKQLVDNMLGQFMDNDVELKAVEQDYLQQKIPHLKSDWNYAVWEAECCDIDASALHNAYLQSAQRNGSKLLCSVQYQAARRQDNIWHITTNKGEHSADIIINAAGAWADDVAIKSNIKPIGITPYRRTVIECQIQQDIPDVMPLVVALDGSFYFKALANNHIWLSPHDETKSAACDAAPEEMDIAIAIDRLQKVVAWDIVKIVQKWAGLRSFSRDRLPIIGFDKDNDNYFWFAGQGGFGIQTAPATAKIASHIILQNILPKEMENIAIEKYKPDRF